MPRYAQINQEKICIVDSNLAGEFNSDDMIPISSTEPSPLGKRYANGLLEEVPIEPVKPQPTTQDIINASLLTSIQEIKVILGGGANV